MNPMSKKSAMALVVAFGLSGFPSAGLSQDTNAPAKKEPESAAPARKKIIQVKLREDVTIIVDCNKLTPDNKLTFDFLKQFDTHNHGASWNVPPERQRDPVILRATLLHILNDKSLWTVEKFNKVLDACNVDAGSRKMVPDRLMPTQPSSPSQP
jgi:hypothetical protein